MQVVLFCFGFYCAAALATVDRMQFTILDRKRFAFIDHPFVKTTPAKRFALVFFLCAGFFEAYYIAHPI